MKNKEKFDNWTNNKRSLFPAPVLNKEKIDHLMVTDQKFS